MHINLARATGMQPTLMHLSATAGKFRESSVMVLKILVSHRNGLPRFLRCFLDHWPHCHDQQHGRIANITSVLLDVATSWHGLGKGSGNISILGRPQVETGRDS